MDLTAERFEESLFMAKAPYNPVNEHLNNLKSVLDTHKYFMEHVGSLDKEACLEKTSVELGDDYFERLDSNDFNFDPNACTIVGSYAAQVISSSKSIADLQEFFNISMQKTYTEIATGKGMRDQDGVFWGEKGHEVVNKKLKIDVVGFLQEFPDDPSKFAKKLSENEKSFMDRIDELYDFILEFDMKDKEQYKGSREIYVMTEMTKLLQNPIEKFFGNVCKCFPNELIHKPSGSRPKYIHSKIFEQDYENEFVLYCTMDCRKWAPRSNLWKYYYFVKGMKSALPESFYNYFMRFWHLMFKKRIRIQKSFVEKLLTNEGYRWVEEMLQKRSDGDYELIMPYSFMMGIFNYLSSLMHAASQMYFSDRYSDKLGVVCNFIAHSDDSGGIIVARSEERALRAFRVYERFQRTLNHLMSRKKCVLSQKGFEMISIMYNNKRFIPMTHKFLSNIALDLKASGWYKDVCTIVGKVVDLFNNGGTLLQCYGMMLAMSEMLRKAYHLPRHEYLSHTPLAMGGVFNLHPIHMILLGSKCHEALLDLVEDPSKRTSRIKQYKTICGDYNYGAPEQPVYEIQYYKMSSSKLDLDSEQITRLNAIATLPLKTTMIDHVKHHSRLFDQSYNFSLSGVDSTQLMLATLFYPCHIRLNEKKVISLKSLSQAYLSMYLLSFEDEDVFPMPEGSHSAYLRQTENIKFDYQKINVVSTKSCKPLRYNTVDNFNLKISQENLMYLSAFEKWDQLKKVFYAPERFDVLKEYLMRSMPGDEEDKIKYLKNFDPSEKEDRNRSAYLFMPSGVSIDSSPKFFTYSIMYCTRRYSISSQKPQLYTPTEFNFEGKFNRDYRHQYLIFKLMEKNLESRQTLAEHYRSCTHCKWQGMAEVNLYSTYFDSPEMQEFNPSLPFVDYITSQIRGRNIWFSDCDFNIHYLGNTIESRQVQGDIVTTWYVEDMSMLGQMWDYYRVFCDSRGIKHAKPKNENTGFDYPKLAFNDFSSPYIPQLGQIAMVLPNSRVYLKSTQAPMIHRRGSKFFIADRVVDFKIQHIYDVNKMFFEQHCLKSISGLIYDIELEMDPEILKKYFSESKTYSVLLFDERHSSYQPNKYTRNGMLGAPGSFTRALALADEQGVVRYRSSYNPAYHTKGAIEYDRIEGVPVLDLFEKISFSRLTAYEMVSFERAMGGKFLTAQDKENLKKIRNKLGLEGLGLTIEAYKHVFRGMSAGTLMRLPAPLIKDLTQKLIHCIHDCMMEHPANNDPYQYRGSRKSFWHHVSHYLNKAPTDTGFSLLLTRGILRSKLDNQHKFWALIRDDVLLSCLTINKSYFGNLVSFVRGLLNSVKDYGNGVRDVFYESEQPLFRHLIMAERYSRDKAKESIKEKKKRVSESEEEKGSEDSEEDEDDEEESEEDEEEDEFEPEIVTNFRMGHSNDAFIAEEDYLDSFSSMDDEGLEDLDEQEEREWDGDKEYKAVVYTVLDGMKVMEETALNDYASITIASPSNFICFPWLGRGDFEMKRVDGIDYYVSSYPGESISPEKDLFKVKDLNIVETRELTDEETNIKVESSDSRYIPNTIKDKKLAAKVLMSQNINVPGLLAKMLPGPGISMEEMLKDIFDTVDLFGEMDIGEIIRRRKYGKHHLPGFQGVLQDSTVVAEMRALFGENSYNIFTGHIKVSKATYNQMMKAIKRLFNKADVQDRSMLLLLIAILQDTIPDSESDSWFCDKANEYIEAIDNKVFGDEDEVVILPVNPTSGHLVYKIKDIYD